MIKVAIVDDTESAREQLRSLLLRYQAEHGVEFHISCFADGDDLVNVYKPVYDLVFLDVEMPRTNGMRAAAEIRKVDGDVTLVFVTRMAQYAVNGYEVDAMDYLLKPLSYPAFETRMERILSRLRIREEKFILLSFADGFRKEPADSIYYIEVTKHKLRYHTKDGDFETKDSLKRVEEELEGYGFARCDNSFLVNLKYVTEVGPKELVVAGDTIKISRPRRKEFIDALARFVGGTP